MDTVYELRDQVIALKQVLLLKQPDCLYLTHFLTFSKNYCNCTIGKKLAVASSLGKNIFRSHCDSNTMDGG